MGIVLQRNSTRADVVGYLRRVLMRIECGSREPRVFSFGHASIDERLPRSGLAAGALHEIVPETEEDSPAAFGFLATLVAIVAKSGPWLFVSPRRFHRYGSLHGHGLNALGIDPSQVMLVEAETELEARWAIEEGLKSCAPLAVAGAIGKNLTLSASQRLSIAAEKSSLPLLLLRPADAMGSTAASTRWRIGGAEAARDRFGLITGSRWRVSLERCRNGRLGEWLVEFDHAAHRFSMAAPVASSSVSGERGEERFAKCASGP